MRNFWEGLQCGLFPMLGKEMRGRTRGWRSLALLCVYLGILSGCVMLFLWLNLERLNYIRPQVGLSLYTLFVFSLVLLISFIAPAVSASAISGEKERRTYDLLLVTKASLTGIVLGKWLASVAYIIFLAAAALPVFAVVFFFGGVPPVIFGLAFVVCLAAGLGYGALGLALSAVFKRTQAATVISIVVVFLFIFGIPVITGIIQASDPSPASLPPVGQQVQVTGPPWYIFLTPLTAFSSVLPGVGNYGHQWGIPVISDLLNMMLDRVMRMDVTYAYKTGSVYAGYASASLPGAQGLGTWPFWARFAFAQGALTLFSLATAVFAMLGRKPWAAAWRRRVGRKPASPGH